MPPIGDVDDLPLYSRPNGQDRRAKSDNRPPQQRHFGAWLDGKVVGHSVLHLTTGALGVAGLYSVGVVPSARRRGIGAAVTLAACEHARAVGCHWATLNAATHIYDRLGFVSLGWGQTWWMHGPVLAALPPSKSEVAFAEAVGRGDMKALDDLHTRGETPSNLDAPLLCGMTPMEMAIRPRQARLSSLAGRTRCHTGNHPRLGPGLEGPSSSDAGRRSQPGEPPPGAMGSNAPARSRLAR